jgi:hypothetical protein
MLRRVSRRTFAAVPIYLAALTSTTVQMVTSGSGGRREGWASQA